MATNMQEFVTTVRLNTTEAVNKLEELKKKTENLKKRREEMIAQKASSEDIKDLTSQISKAESSMRTLQKQTVNFADVMKRLDSAPMKELQMAEKQLNAEMRKTETNTAYYSELAARLRTVRERLAALREESKAPQARAWT